MFEESNLRSHNYLEDFRYDVENMEDMARKQLCDYSENQIKELWQAVLTKEEVANDSLLWNLETQEQERLLIQKYQASLWTAIKTLTDETKYNNEQITSENIWKELTCWDKHTLQENNETLDNWTYWLELEEALPRDELHRQVIHHYKTKALAIWHTKQLEEEKSLAMRQALEKIRQTDQLSRRILDDAQSYIEQAQIHAKDMQTVLQRTDEQWETMKKHQVLETVSLGQFDLGHSAVPISPINKDLLKHKMIYGRTTYFPNILDENQVRKQIAKTIFGQITKEEVEKMWVATQGYGRKFHSTAELRAAIAWLVYQTTALQYVQELHQHPERRSYESFSIVPDILVNGPIKTEKLKDIVDITIQDMQQQAEWFNNEDTQEIRTTEGLDIHPAHRRRTVQTNASTCVLSERLLEDDISELSLPHLIEDQNESSSSLPQLESCSDSVTNSEDLVETDKVQFSETT